METLSAVWLAVSRSLAQQGQSSSSPHPESILSQSAPRTFHHAPRPPLGLSWIRKTLSLEPFYLLFLSSLSPSLPVSMSQTELHLCPFPLLLPSCLFLFIPPTPHCQTCWLAFFQLATLTPAGQRWRGPSNHLPPQPVGAGSEWVTDSQKGGAPVKQGHQRSPSWQTPLLCLFVSSRQETGLHPWMFIRRCIQSSLFIPTMRLLLWQT